MSIPYDEEIRRAIGPDRQLRVLTSTGSTNEDALRWAGDESPAPDGSCVVADQQVAGRGRWGRSWESAPGRALMFSVILRPSGMPVQRLGLLTSAMGVACAEAIGDLTGLAPTLKWPNDVNIRSRKVAGILFETQFTGQQVAVVVAGVGVNTHWSLVEIPADLRERATSLAVETDGPPGRGALLAAILQRFEPWYLGVTEGSGADAVCARADELSGLKGQQVEVTWPDGRTARGVARGLDATGGLNVQIDDVDQVVDVGEVTRVRSAAG